jgi:hypothetical protein
MEEERLGLLDDSGAFSGFCQKPSQRGSSDAAPLIKTRIASFTVEVV